ncbi:MAG: hypothetical protein ACJ75J_00845 [Cytophagaceae bacterium]
MKNLALLFFLISSLSGICQQAPGNKKGKIEDPFGMSVNITPAFTRLSPQYSSIFGYDLGADFAFFPKDNIWGSLGVRYSHKSFKQDPLNVQAKDNPSNVTAVLDYYEFPLSAHYRTGDFSRVTHDEKKHLGHQAKIGFCASAGIVPGVLWDGKNNYSGTASDHQIDKTELKNAGYKSIISARGSIGFYYHLTHHFFVTVEPEYKYSFSKVPKGSNYHWTSLGFNITLWYRILPQFGV